MLQKLITALLLFNGLTAYALQADQLQLSDVDKTYKVAKVDYKRESFSDAELKKTPHTIQIAAYLTEADAIQHVIDLRKTEKDAFYYPTHVRGQLWYKVCVGRFASVEEATKRQQAFIKKHDEPFSVVISLDKTVYASDKIMVAEKAPKANSRMPASVAETKSEPAKLTTYKEAPREPVQMVKSNKEVIEVGKKEPPIRVFENSKKSEPVPVKTGGNSELSVQLIPKNAAAKHTAAMVGESKKDVIAATAHYTLQVAAFSTQAEAQAFLATFKTTGRVQQAVINGKTWHRVYLGEFTSIADVEALRAQIKAEKNIDGLVRKSAQ